MPASEEVMKEREVFVVLELVNGRWACCRKVCLVILVAGRVAALWNVVVAREAALLAASILYIRSLVYRSILDV